MRRAARTDATQRPIVDALRKCGWFWIDATTLGFGKPDGFAVKPGKVRLVEIKTPKGKLTADQIDFHALCPEPIHILRSVDDAVALK